MFRSASTDLGHALVVCDLTQIPAEGSGYRWGTVGIQCLSQELKKVRHMSHQAEKGETHVSPS